MSIKQSFTRGKSGQAGYNLVELVVSMGIMTAILGSTALTMQQAMRANETAILVTGMNNNLRTGMDLMVRDLLQVGSGLPPGHVILVPSGSGTVPVRLPGPPGTTFLAPAGDTDFSAVVPGPGLGVTINGVPTDVITFLAADNNFVDIPLTAFTNTTIDIAATNPSTGLAIVINSGPDRLLAGQLLMLEKGSNTTFVQITAVNYTSRRVTFNTSDSLRLNQPVAGAAGNTVALRAQDPPDVLPAAPAAQVIPTNATRIRMITYYLDTVVPNHPRLVRRINNGHPTAFDNTLGTAVALDIENLQFTYDLADGLTNPSNVRFTAADLAGTGACSPNACSVNMIRKVNLALTGRSKNIFARQNRLLRNTLTSQVSLRGMAFVDEYLAP